MSRRVQVSAAVAGLALVASAALPLPSGPATATADPTTDPTADVAITAPEQTEMAKLLLPSTDVIPVLEADGLDLTHAMRTVADGQVEVIALVTPTEQDQLAERGVEVLDTAPLPSQRELAADRRGRAPTVDPRRQAAPSAVPESSSATAEPAPTGPDELRVLRADWFTNNAGSFLSVEATAAAGRDAVVTVTAPDGAGGVAVRELEAFVDAGQYLYHRFDDPVPTVPDPGDVVVTVAGGPSVTVGAVEWTESDDVGYPTGYEWGFTDDGYVDAVQANETVERLAAEFPGLAEVVDLPYQSNGYRAKAQAVLGTTTATAIIATSTAYGSEGGNGLRVRTVADAPGQALSVSVGGGVVTVALATDATGAPTSTAAQVAAAVAASPASALVTVTTYAGNTGAGVVAAGQATLDDGLDAPDSYPRTPLTAKALRIGSVRDGSRTGVLMYSAEHAREWVTPLVALETAERLLRNYGTDATTTSLVDGLDMFIVPIVNPDGVAFSLYDDLLKRKNMVEYCPPGQLPPAAQVNQGVDLNRNFRIGSRLDGFVGASANCASGTYSGPSEVSEQETKNELWLVDQNPNIKFAMNTHSSGGYFMWAPGAYRAEGREPLPRPSVGIEEYFFEASRSILDRVKQHRGTVVHPGRTGPVIDVLYSAAGNSADDANYGAEVDEGDVLNPEIFAWDFEVGADIWDGEEWQSSGGFWPDFEDEGFDQAMEFSNGWLGILEVAYDYQYDRRWPRTTPSVGTGVYDAPVELEFATDEPATIHYTLDGSRPTTESPFLDRRGLRDEAAPLDIDATTTVRWIAVDAKGNASPPQQVRIRIG